MSINNEINVIASTLDLALVRAAGKLGVASSQVNYRVVATKKPQGLFGFFKKPQVEIVAWTKSIERKSKFDRRDRRTPANEKNGQTSRQDNSQRVKSRNSDTRDSSVEKISIEDLKPVIEELRLYCQDLCSRIVGEAVSVTTALEDNERLVLNVESEEFMKILQKDTKLAESLEHLIRKKPRHLKQEIPFRIFVDSANMRKNREMELRAMASELSKKVSETKRSIVLNYKSAYDRKIIHMSLDNDARVQTKSIGSGAHRKLMILPVGQADSDQTPEQVGDENTES